MVLFLKTSKNYNPQVFLEECKYVVKEKMIPKCIIVDIEISSDSDKENLMKKIKKHFIYIYIYIYIV